MPRPRGAPPPTAQTPLVRTATRAPRWVVVAVCLVLAGATAGAIGLTLRADAARTAAPRAGATATGSPSTTQSSTVAPTTEPTRTPTKAAAAPSTGVAAASATPRPNPCPLDPPYTGPIFVTSTPAASGDGSNGRLPASALARLPSWANDPMGTPQYLRPDAAAALVRLNDAFRGRFGSTMDIDLTYRSYPDQVAIRAALGTIAAKPGTSRHGTGNALDVQEWSCIYGFGTEKREWLVANAPGFGWVSPSWAREGADNPEYWHYEYVA